MSVLYRIETSGNRYITSVEADTRDEAFRKAWRKISAKAPELVPYLRMEQLMIYPERQSGLWGRNEGI